MLVLAILRALAASARRNLATYGALKTNNFFLFVALLIWGALVSGVEPVSSYPFLVLLAVLLLFPIASDPMDRVPATRLALWPLGSSQRMMLRLASLAFSPMLWVTAVLLALRASFGVAAFFVCFAIAVPALTAMTGSPGWSIAHLAPRMPGAIGLLVSANVRAMLTVLDTWLALVIALVGTVWRVLATPDPGALPILAMLIAVALSTWTQCLFALDAGPGMTRYRLLPVRGWQVLLAKDIAVLGILALLSAALDAAAALAFGLGALAIGRYVALVVHLHQRRWRFSSGRVLCGVLQGLIGATLGFHAREGGLAAALAIYGVALYWGGRVWDRQGNA